MTTELFLRFPDRDMMLLVASALVGRDGVQTLPTDGWLPTPDGTFYWNLCERGEIPDLGPGYYVLGLWSGPEETVPDALAPFRTGPDDRLGRFG